MLFSWPSTPALPRSVQIDLFSVYANLQGWRFLFLDGNCTGVLKKHVLLTRIYNERGIEYAKKRSE